MSVEKQVQARYSDGAKEKQEALCCPVDYQSHLLEILPEEIIEKDYGCGDPSRYVKEGDVVLDLGSGGGKICYMAAQLVGQSGFVHGVDMTDDMLALARKYQAELADKIGQNRVAFHKGYIQDLAYDIEAAARYIEDAPIIDEASLMAFDVWKSNQAKTTPLIEDASVSLVISNCVLNLVDRSQRQNLFDEIFRVLKPGGRVAISDIICDQAVPRSMQNDPELWSGCISGAFEEAEFIQAFNNAGFVDVSYDKWEDEPWQVVEGIVFRSVTLLATKPLAPVTCGTKDVEVLYKGPFQSCTDDNGNEFVRGKRQSIKAHLAQQIANSVYAESFVFFSGDKLASVQGKPKSSCC